MGFDTFNDILQFAIDKEQEAIELYKHASTKAEHSSSQKMFEELADMEKGHKRMLEELDVDKVETSEVEEVPDLKIGDYLLDIKFSPDLNYQEILTLAMKREENSVKLYTQMKKKFGQPGLNKLLDRLIKEEKNHKYMLEKEYDDRILSDNY